MASETDFLNDALGQIGQGPITNIQDGSQAANWCRTFWPPLRRGMLRMHHWKFADTRIALAVSATAPLYEFAYAYALPRDLLAIREYNGTLLNLAIVSEGRWVHWEGFYKVEGDFIYTNDGEARLLYTRDITNPDLWDPLFYQAAASWLASKLALAIFKNDDLSKGLLSQVFGMLLPQALVVDGQQGTKVAYVVDDLIWGRD